MTYGSSRIVIIFTRVCWGRGSMVAVHFLNVDYDALHFRSGSFKINIFKVLLRGREGVTKKEYSVYAFENIDNSGRPNTHMMYINYNWMLFSISRVCTRASRRSRSRYRRMTAMTSCTHSSTPTRRAGSGSKVGPSPLPYDPGVLRGVSALLVGW